MTKTLENLTLAEAIAALRAAVEVRGANFVYPEEEKFTPTLMDGTVDPNQVSICMYTRGGEGEAEGKLVGSCVVGVALIDVLGVDPERLAGLQASADVALEHLGITEHKVITRVYLRAQGNQDAGIEWGAAVEDALEHYADDIATALAAEAR